MRDHLRSLIFEMSQLDLSSTEAVHAMLNNHYPLNGETFDDNLKPYVAKLNNVFDLLQQLDQTRVTALRISADREALANYRSKLDQITAELNELKPLIVSANEKLDRLYEQIETLAPQAIDDPLVPVCKISHRQDQIERVKHLLYTFQKANQEIQLPLWLSEREDLIRALKQFGVIAPADDREGHLELYRKIQLDIDTLSDYQHLLESIQQNLAYFISDKNIQNLEDTLPLLQNRLIEKTQQLADFPLSTAQMQLLTEQFEQSFDSQQFHQQREEDIIQLESRYNITSWYKWMLDYQNHAEQIIQKKKELQFIKGLQEQASIKASITATEKSISKYEPSDRDQVPKITLQDMLAQGIKILYQLKLYGLHTDKPDSLMELNDDHSATVLLTLLMEAMTYCALLKDKKIQAKDYLHRIIKLNGYIRELQIQYNLIDSTSNTSIAMQELALNNPSASQSYYRELIHTCQDYLSLLQEFNKKTERSRSLVESQSRLAKLIKRKDTAISRHSSVPDPSSILASASFEIKELLHLSSLDEQDLITGKSEEQTKDTPPFDSVYEREEMLSWHCKIQSRYRDTPLSFQKWYKQLYQAMNSQPITAHDYKKACQLLRDIYFELEHPLTQSYPVLLSYQSTFASPAHSLALILAMKPAFSPLYENFDKVQDTFMAKALQLLYEKSEKLKQSYPVEARLLFQATQSIHHAASLVERDPKGNFKAYSGNILDDPRYERLKRHRGLFFLLWEKLEYCSRYLLSKITREKHCIGLTHCSFFKTQSTRLLLAAEKKLSDLRTAKFDQQLALTSSLCHLSS